MPARRWPLADIRHSPATGHSEFTTTAIASRAIQLYMPQVLKQETAKQVQRARNWLLQAQPATTEDATFRLLGLAWTAATDAQRAPAIAGLQKLQRANGGWAPLPTREPDAYATGEALVALNAGGVPVTDPSWRKGLQFLVSTQNPDGSWRGPTRMVSPAQVSPPYFESGFPFGHDQFISAAGTSYAAMAVMLAMPKVGQPAMPLPLIELTLKGEKPWMRTALFGTAAELKALLEKGSIRIARPRAVQAS